MSELISIVMPCYNAEKTLKKSLDSIFAQSFQDFKVYCVNDGSTDQTPQILNQLALLYKNLHVIHQNNQGQTKAKNAALKICQGRYIAFLDSDDLWDEDKLLFQYALMKKDESIGLCYTNGCYIDEDDMPQGKIGYNQALQGNCLKSLLLGNAIVASSVMIRADLLKRVGLFDEKLTACENWELWTRIASVSRLAIIDKPLTFYRRHGNNMSHNIEKMRKNRLYVVSKNSHIYRKKLTNYQAITKEAYYRAYQFFGENYLWKMQLKPARENLRKALQYKPFDWRTYMLYGKTLLGETLLTKIRARRQLNEVMEP